VIRPFNDLPEFIEQSKNSVFFGKSWPINSCFEVKRGILNVFSFYNFDKCVRNEKYQKFHDLLVLGHLHQVQIF
jgi:hypothetical protein